MDLTSFGIDYACNKRTSDRNGKRGCVDGKLRNKSRHFNLKLARREPFYFELDSPSVAYRFLGFSEMEIGSTHRGWNCPRC